MRSIYLISIGLMMTLSLYAQSDSKNIVEGDGAAINFNETKHDFGDIYQGDKVEHVFRFKNTGNKPLVLNNVLTTCGCTAPQWPKDPIPPGEEGEIKVVFDSSGKMGRQNKIITIRSNAIKSDHRLKIITMVLPKK